MKRRFFAAMLALSLSLTGCASLLAREYSSVTTHNAAPTAEDDPSILRAESYQELVNALLYFVTNGAETGMIRLYLASDLVGPSLENACLEVVQEDPLGAYAVDFIKFSVNSVVTYSEAEVHITYRRSQEQIDSIIPATGITAIRSELVSAMESCDPECVLRVSYFNGDEDSIRTLARQAYLQNPTSILDYPDSTISIYPDSGRQRIVEIKLTYHEEASTLTQQREDLNRQLHAMSLHLSAAHNAEDPLAVADTVLTAVKYDEKGDTTAFDALASGSADSEGLALTYAALCEILNLPCRVIEGSKQDVPYFWNLVETDSGWRHIDLPALAEQDQIPLVDQEMMDLSYLWDTSFYPQSGPKPEE